MNQTQFRRDAAAGGIEVGMEVPPLEVVVSAEKMKTTAALLADPNPIHFDVRAVRALGLGDRPVNQGPLNMGYVMNMLAAFTGSHDRLRRLRVRFLANVLAGDRVRAGGVVTGLCLSPDHGEYLAECDVDLSTVDGRPVLQGTATVAVPASRVRPAEAHNDEETSP
ncbi:MaoC family dehydratase [Arthrobacter sp. GCM10027362]|uniref:MaoC family dehydratase n=1 Tax=Arthrobacter sp. GCM10027362 TaxID=3273379 RepID=UPI00364350D2